MTEQNPNTPDPDPVDQTDDVAALRQEAASRRRALRATEAERDTLRERLDGYDRAEVDKLIGERFADPADFWLGKTLDEFRADDGTIDQLKIEAEAERALNEKPHWRKPEPQLPPVSLHQGARESVPPPPPSLGQAIKQAARNR